MPTSNRALNVMLAIASVAVIVALIVAQQQRSAASAETDGADGADDARVDADELAGAVASASSAMASPAHDLRDAAGALRDATADAVTGTGDRSATRERIQLRAERLRAAAADLGDAADAGHAMIPVPSDALSDALSDSTVDEVLDDVAGVGEQATTVADLARRAADRTERVGLAALGLTAAAADLVAATEDLPDSDDPQAVADAWHDDLVRLEAYRAAAERAAEHASLAELAAAHLAIVDELEGDAQTSLELLADGDIDAYNTHREDRLGDATTFGDELMGATQASLAASLAQIEDAEARALALLTELEAVRRDAPDHLADG